MAKTKRVEVCVLAEGELSRSEAFDLVAEHALLLGSICGGKGIDTLGRELFEPEICDAAEWVSVDVVELIGALGTSPDAETLALVRRDNVADSETLSDTLAWLSLARAYRNQGRQEVGFIDDGVAPCVAMLRERARIRAAREAA